jgi:hypothetical protein
MKRIFWIEFWLWIFPPWGIWLLYKDKQLTRSAKIRLLIYSFLIPIAVVFALSIYLLHHTAAMLNSMNA